MAAAGEDGGAGSPRAARWGPGTPGRAHAPRGAGRGDSGGAGPGSGRGPGFHGRRRRARCAAGSGWRAAGRAAPALSGLPPRLRAGRRPAPANLRAGEPRGRRGRGRRGSQWNAALSAAPSARAPAPARPSDRTARPEPRSASPPPGGVPARSRRAPGRQTRPVGDFLRTRAPRPRRKMQTFLKGKRVGYWLSEKKIKKLNFQAFAELCR